MEEAVRLREAHKQKLVPPTTAVVAQISTVATGAETLISMSTSIEVEIQNHDTDNPVYLKYATGVVASTGNFDDCIPAGVTRNYILPEDATQISLIATTASCAVVVIGK